MASGFWLLASGFWSLTRRPLFPSIPRACLAAVAANDTGPSVNVDMNSQVPAVLAAHIDMPAKSVGESHGVEAGPGDPSGKRYLEQTDARRDSSRYHHLFTFFTRPQRGFPDAVVHKDGIGAIKPVAVVCAEDHDDIAIRFYGRHPGVLEIDEQIHNRSAQAGVVKPFHTMGDGNSRQNSKDSQGSQ